MSDPGIVSMIEHMGPLASFPWHTQQQFALASATNVVVVLGGNRSGKTTAAAGIVSRLVRREGPVYRRLRNPSGRALRVWVSPQLFEKYKSNWEDRLLNEVFDGMPHAYTQTPQPVIRWDDSEGGGSVWGKSQDQGFLAFESDEVDLIVFDEEPKDPRLYSSAQQRLATTNGIIVYAFTPLMGMSSHTYGSFYIPTVRPEYEVADRVWRRGNDITLIQMGMADNPEAVAGGGVVRIQNDAAITEGEKRTRLYGEYGFAEGLIFPEFATLSIDDADNAYTLDGLPVDRAYSWFLTCDPNKKHGGLLTAIDHEDNRYLVAEHYLEGVPDRVHAKHYHAMLAHYGLLDGAGRVRNVVGIYADPGGAGAQAIINLADHGIYAQAVKKDAGSVKASIELIRRAAELDPLHPHPVTGQLGAPHIYFLKTLKSTWRVAGVEYHESRLMWELRQYRQKDNSPPDTPIKELDDVVDCARYMAIVRPYSPTKVDRTVELQRSNIDNLSRKANDEFDELARIAKEPKRVRGDFW